MSAITADFSGCRVLVTGAPRLHGIATVFNWYRTYPGGKRAKS